MKKQKIVKLGGCGYSALVNLSRGGNCISLRNLDHGVNILREPDYSAELDNPYLYGMPILFPVNRISKAEFEFEGRIYRFPVNEPATGCHLHGTLHQTEFQLVSVSDRSLICSYCVDRNNMYHGFPHDFEIIIHYELKENGFHQTTKVVNHSEENMPVLLGFHSTFNALFSQDSKPENMMVRVDISEEYERNMKNYLPTGSKPDYDRVSKALNKGEFNPFSEPISRHYRSGVPGKMVIYDAGNDLSVVYENDEKLGFRLIYNGNADGYICLEPQNCLANSPNAPISRSEAGFDYIEPRKCKVYTSKIYVAVGDCRR